MHCIINLNIAKYAIKTTKYAKIVGMILYLELF